MNPNPLDARIAEVECYTLRLTGDENPAGFGYDQYEVVEVRLESGTIGYSFAGPSAERAAELPALLSGRRVCSVDEMLADGLDQYFGAEHAIWDAIGRTLGTPVHQLLGSGVTRLPTYLTLVWPGPTDQHHVNTEQALEAVRRYTERGFRRFKIRCWQDPRAVAELCRAMALGADGDIAVMVDRTAHISGEVWNVEEAAAAAYELKLAGVRWLEEPLARDDWNGYEQLARVSPLAVVGGEGFCHLEDFARAAASKAYQALQPDAGIVGGIRRSLEVATITRAHGTPCIPHGQGGLRLAGWLHANAAISGDLQELALIPPPHTPDEAWSPARAVLRDGADPFAFDGGDILMPSGPGLGLDIDREALTSLRRDQAG